MQVLKTTIYFIYDLIWLVLLYLRISQNKRRMKMNGFTVNNVMSIGNLKGEPRPPKCHRKKARTLLRKLHSSVFSQTVLVTQSYTLHLAETGKESAKNEHSTSSLYLPD